MSKYLVSLSGGLDSTTALYKVVKDYGKENIFAVSFKYGQKQDRELELAEKSCKKLGVNWKLIDLTTLTDFLKLSSSNIKGSDISTPTIKDVLGDPQPNTYVPFRNLMFTSITASYAESIGADYLVVGWMTRDMYGYWDTTPEFKENLENIFKLNRKHTLKIISPLINMTKTEEVKVGMELGVDYSLTLSCYNPNEKGESCGKCPTCAERIMAFKNNNIKDPIDYQINIEW